jgi:hypothetical protein
VKEGKKQRENDQICKGVTKKSTTDLEECCMTGKTLHSSAKENK